MESYEYHNNLKVEPNFKFKYNKKPPLTKDREIESMLNQSIISHSLLLFNIYIEIEKYFVQLINHFPFFTIN